MNALNIIYQDDVCVAIDKPAGLLVHRTALDSRATEFAVQILRDQIGQRVYPVHRLDKATSGILVFGLNSETARDLTEQFGSRRAKKNYTAFVRGFCEDSGTISLPLRDPVDARSDSRKHGIEREAVTDFETLTRYELPFSDGRHPTSRYSLIELKPRTGRRHQLRRHLKHAAHPIIGDTTHGDHRQNKRFAQRYNLSRMLLAATKLELTHPVTGAYLGLETSCGGAFVALLDELAKFSVQAQS